MKNIYSVFLTHTFPKLKIKYCGSEYSCHFNFLGMSWKKLEDTPGETSTSVDIPQTEFLIMGINVTTIINKEKTLI